MNKIMCEKDFLKNLKLVEQSVDNLQLYITKINAISPELKDNMLDKLAYDLLLMQMVQEITENYIDECFLSGIECKSLIYGLSRIDQIHANIKNLINKIDSGDSL